MNSLSDLNNASRKPIPFSDPRTPGIVFSSNVATNQNITVLQNGHFSVPEGINIVAMSNPEVMFLDWQPNTEVITSGLEYTVDVGYFTDRFGKIYTRGNVDWGNTVAVSTDYGTQYRIDNPFTTGNIFVSPGPDFGTNELMPEAPYPDESYGKFWARGIKNVQDWNEIKNPTVNLPIETTNRVSTTIHSTITSANVSYSWYTNVTVYGLDELSPASNDFTAVAGDNTITGHPTISQLSNVSLRANTYTCNVSYTTSNAVSSLSASGAASSTWDSANHVLSITGTASEVNNSLQNIHYTPASGYSGRWIATYDLYNPVSGFTSREIQYIKINPNAYGTTPDATYWDDNALTVFSGPEMTGSTVENIWIYSNDFLANITGTGTSVVHSTAIASMSTDFGTQGGPDQSFAGAWEWDNTYKILKLTGSKDELNRMLSSLKLQPAIDATGVQFHLTYEYRSSDLTLLGTDVQLMLFNNSIGGVSNLDYSRTFVSNTADQLLFASNVPQIIETTPTGTTYSVTLSTAAGNFGFDYATSTNVFSFSGTKTSVNSSMANVKFYPNKDVSGSQQFTFNVTRGGNVLVNSPIAYTGTARTTPISATAGTYVFTSNSSFTPSGDQIYMNCDVLVVGGGGAGGQVAGSCRAAGGGSAGAVVGQVGTALPAGTLSIVVGAGGSGTYAMTMDGANGQSSAIKRHTGVSIFSAAPGTGGGGGNDQTVKTLDGGSTGNSNGTTSGGTWAHLGGNTGSYWNGSAYRYWFGGGGGGAKTAGSAGRASDVTPSTGSNFAYGGAGLTASDFALITATGKSTIAPGGAGGATYTDAAATTYGEGGMGGVVTPYGTGNGRAGYQGVVVIKFY